MIVEDLAVELDRRRRGAAFGLVRVAGPGALLGHLSLEAGEVDRPAPFRRDLAGQVDRVAEGVVEEERALARDVAGREHFIQQVLAPLERGAEPLLFAPDHVRDELVVLLQLRVRAAHDCDRCIDERGRDEIPRAEPVRVTDRPADDAAQDVAPLHVARHHAVGDQEGHGAAVLREDPQRDIGVAAREALVGDPGRLLGRCDERPEHVDVPDRLGALEHREVALEARAGVHARLRQRNQRAVRLRVELHEDEVPDLDVAVLAPVLRAALGAELRAEVPEDLGARAARAGVAHAPEVVVAQALDPRRRHADVVAPDRLGLVVGLVDGDPEPLRIEARAPRV